jgi:PKD repeat protein
MRLLIPLLVLAFFAFLPAVSAELRVVVMSPNGGELWWGYRTIQWSGACDPPDNVTYRIEISTDGGSSWGYVDEKSFWEENIPALHEVGFSTAGIAVSTKCLVRVIAKSLTYGFENSDVSDNFFTIQNITVENLYVPAIAVTGDNVRVTILLRNDSTSSWTGQLEILLTGPERISDKTSSVTVGPGQTVPVSRRFTLTKKGVYTVSVGDKSATIKVLSPTEVNVPGDVSVYWTDYYCEIPIIGYKVTRQYYSATIYRGLGDYRGYRCMKWQTVDVQDPEACWEYYYTFITPDEKESRQVGTVHYETTQITIVNFDPPAKSWTWPATSFTSDWSNYSMIIMTKYGGQEYTLEITGKARFRIELGGTRTLRTKWGTDEEVQIVTVYTDIKDATIEIDGSTGTAGGTLRLTKYIGEKGTLREEADSKIDLNVGGLCSSIVVKYISDMLCYSNYWLGYGGDPNYYRYLGLPPEPSVNIPPIAKFTYSPTSPTIDDTVQFTDMSTDLDGTIVSYIWNFGDGTTSTLRNPTKKYSSSGSYKVTLTVTDNGGVQTTTSKTILIALTPRPATLTISPASFTLRSGSTVTLTATLRDSAGNPIFGRTISWSATAGSFSVTAARTNSLGQVQTVYTAPDLTIESPVIIMASFAGDDQYLACSASCWGTVSPLQLPPSVVSVSLKLSPDTFTIQSGASVSLVAVLFGPDLNPLAGETIGWAVTAGEVSPMRTTTDSQGRAMVIYTAPVVEVPTAVMVVATFGGDNRYQPAVAVSKGLVVVPEVARAVENLTTSLQDLKFSVDNLAKEISKLAEAISGGKVAVSVTVRLEKETRQVEVKRDFQHEQVQVQVEVKGNNIIAKISSENREGRTVVLNIDNYILPIVNVQHVKVEVDGKEIPLADNYEDVLDPMNDGDQAEYLILVGGEGIHVLVSLPHFSTRTITIRGPAAVAPTAWAPLMVAVSIVIIVLILLLAFRRRSRISS